MDKKHTVQYVIKQQQIAQGNPHYSGSNLQSK